MDLAVAFWCPELQFQLLIGINNETETPRNGSGFHLKPPRKNPLVTFIFYFAFSSYVSSVAVLWFETEPYPIHSSFTQRVYVDFNRNGARLLGQGLYFPSPSAQGQQDPRVFIPWSSNHPSQTQRGLCLPPRTPKPARDGSRSSEMLCRCVSVCPSPCPPVPVVSPPPPPVGAAVRGGGGRAARWPWLHGT